MAHMVGLPAPLVHAAMTDRPGHMGFDELRMAAAQGGAPRWYNGLQQDEAQSAQEADSHSDDAWAAAVVVHHEMRQSASHYAPPRIHILGIVRGSH